MKHHLISPTLWCGFQEYTRYTGNSEKSRELEHRDNEDEPSTRRGSSSATEVHQQCCHESDSCTLVPQIKRHTFLCINSQWLKAITSWSLRRGILILRSECIAYSYKGPSKKPLSCVNWYGHLEEQYGIAGKTKTSSTLWYSSSAYFRQSGQSLPRSRSCSTVLEGKKPETT